MSKPIGLHPENPRYFLYKGRPLVLITATEHYGAVINRNFDYVAYLDDAAEKRQTLSRCFLLFRELQVFDPATQVKPINPHSPCKPLPGEYVAPFVRSGPGFATDGYPKFDLDRWNPEYFERLRGFSGGGAGAGCDYRAYAFQQHVQRRGVGAESAKRPEQHKRGGRHPVAGLHFRPRCCADGAADGLRRQGGGGGERLLLLLL